MAVLVGCAVCEHSLILKGGVPGFTARDRVIQEVDVGVVRKYVVSELMVECVEHGSAHSDVFLHEAVWKWCFGWNLVNQQLVKCVVWCCLAAGQGVV
eukprot:6478884-Amphidinium_carterae.1